jgi:hypothetical protein
MGRKSTHYGAGPNETFTGGSQGWATWSLVILACLCAIVAFAIVTVDYVQNRNYRNFQLKNSTNTILLNDVANLNFVLAVDQLKSAAYVVVATKFNTSASIGNVTTTLGDILLGVNILSNLNSFSQQETNDSVSIANLITAKCALLPLSLQTGCAAVVPCNYTFTLNVTTFASSALLLSALETVATTAYPTALGLISDPVADALVGQLLTMESSHSAYWNVVSGLPPTPNALTPLKNQNQVLCTLSTYLFNAATCLPFSLRQFC